MIYELQHIFIYEILIKQIKAKKIVVGDDCSFGYKGNGDKELLKIICDKYNIELNVCEKVKYNDTYISSTYIKKEYDSGNIELVNKLMRIQYE